MTSPTDSRTAHTAHCRLVTAIAVCWLAVAGCSSSGRVEPGSAKGPTLAPSTSRASTRAGDDLSASVARYQATLEQDPKNWYAWANLGSAYVQQGRITADPTYYPKAQTALQRSLNLESQQNFVGMTGMAALTAARHDFSGSLRWSRRAASVNAYSASAYSIMTDALNELGRYDEALTSVQRAVNLKPGVQTFTRVSYARELRGDVPGAIDAMRRARVDAFSPADVAFCDYYLGLLYFNSGNLATAMRAFEAGLRADPTYALLYEGRAKVNAARGHVDAAVRDFQTVVSRYPSPEYVVEFGDYLTAIGRRTQAQAQYDLVDVIERLFRANGVNQDLEITTFEAEHGQASAAIAAGREEWGRRHSIIVADALGWALHAAGRNPEALRYAKIATRLGYRNSLYYYHRGMIEKAIGDGAAARSSLGLALRINPHFSPLRGPLAKKALTELAAKA